MKNKMTKEEHNMINENIDMLLENEYVDLDKDTMLEKNNLDIIKTVECYANKKTLTITKEDDEIKIDIVRLGHGLSIHEKGEIEDMVELLTFNFNEDIDMESIPLF